jgi:hypothetical protein
LRKLIAHAKVLCAQARQITQGVIIMPKSFYVFLAFFLALFVPGRFVPLIGHGLPWSGVAWAQDSTDTDDNSDVSAVKVAPPDIEGSWTGQVDDDSLGVADIDVEIVQKHTKIKGTYAVGDAVGSFKGKIGSNGVTITLNLKQVKSKCRIKAAGTLTEPEPADQGAAVVAQPEISGTYTAKKCGADGITGGSFSITLTPDD